jgi:hypothetical protein
VKGNGYFPTFDLYGMGVPSGSRGDTSAANRHIGFVLKALTGKKEHPLFHRPATERRFQAMLSGVMGRPELDTKKEWPAMCDDDRSESAVWFSFDEPYTFTQDQKESQVGERLIKIEDTPELREWLLRRIIWFKESKLKAILDNLRAKIKNGSDFLDWPFFAPFKTMAAPLAKKREAALASLGDNLGPNIYNRNPRLKREGEDKDTTRKADKTDPDENSISLKGYTVGISLKSWMEFRNLVGKKIKGSANASSASSSSSSS